MELVLVSACLLGLPVRYNGVNRASDNEILRRWMSEARVVSLCPEVAGGLSTPRSRAEIEQGLGGEFVLARKVAVRNEHDEDVTSAFVAGAEHALMVSNNKGIRVAVLKEGSPSCGSGFIYDGSFSGRRAAEAGVTVALLRRSGIKVFNEHQFAEADALLAQFEEDFRLTAD